MKRFLRNTLKIALAIFFLWMAVTIWVESTGPKKKQEFGAANSSSTALVVYDPDPIYNFDEQICKSFAAGLSDNKWKVTVASVAAAKSLNPDNIELFVFCANTYNSAPDWAIERYIKKLPMLDNKKVVAITVGAGSTQKSHRLFESAIRSKHAEIIDSKEFWVWRPNDTTRLNERNVEVGVEMSRSWAKKIARKL